MDNYRINHMRLTGNNKEYWANQLAEFSRRFINKKYGYNSKIIKGVDFGKQDIRGGFSICLIDQKNCIHSDWLEANGYTLHVKKKNKTSQYKAQATRHNPHAKITKKSTGEGTSYKIHATRD